MFRFYFFKKSLLPTCGSDLKPRDQESHVLPTEPTRHPCFYKFLIIGSNHFIFLFFLWTCWVSLLGFIGQFLILTFTKLKRKAYWIMIFPLFSFVANTYLFMVQARGIMLRENVKTIGHMIRLYTNKNTTLNGTGETAAASSCLLLLCTFLAKRGKPGLTGSSFVSK